MAVATWSSSAAAQLVKAVVLPLLILVLLAVSAGASSAEEDEPAVAKPGGRFSETPLGRKLLALKLCGPGSAPNFNCAVLLPLSNNATCCTDIFGNQACFDVGAFLVDKCGSCTTTCKFGQVCCSGVCANLLTDKNNCGFCGHKCRGRCILGFCNY